MREKIAGDWQDIPTPTDEQLSNVRLWPHKEVVEFTSLEQCFEIAALMRGQLGSKHWMEKLLNRQKADNLNGEAYIHRTSET